MRNPLSLSPEGAVGLALLAASALTGSPASAAGADYGPNTCLNGFVWRAAFTGDVVCVTPETRHQVDLDNRAAASRRDPRGAYGPRSCQVPFVWRNSRASDDVCVTVEQRGQAAADNAARETRRNSVRTRLGRWSTPDTTVCDGEVCSFTPTGATYHQVVVDRVNVGRIFLGLYRKGDNRRIGYWYSSARAVAPAGGRAAFRTDRLVCPGTPNAYFAARDLSTGRWSARVPVRVGCARI
jgi:hypothetical protein